MNGYLSIRSDKQKVLEYLHTKGGNGPFISRTSAKIGPKCSHVIVEKYWDPNWTRRFEAVLGIPLPSLAVRHIERKTLRNPLSQRKRN